MREMTVQRVCANHMERLIERRIPCRICYGWKYNTVLAHWHKANPHASTSMVATVSQLLLSIGIQSDRRWDPGRRKDHR